jgi:hypothetical protein
MAKQIAFERATRNQLVDACANTTEIWNSKGLAGRTVRKATKDADYELTVREVQAMIRMLSHAGYASIVTGGRGQSVPSKKKLH